MKPPASARDDDIEVAAMSEGGLIRSQAPEQSAIAVDAATLFQTEFRVAYEEIRNRMDFNRRLLNLQAQGLGASVAAVVFLAGAEQQKVHPRVLEFACGILLWVALAFALENVSNNSHISAAAGFLNQVLNRKYRAAAGDGHAVYDWELYLSAERQHSATWLNRHLFTLDAAFVINVLISVVACVGYYNTVVGRLAEVSRFSAALFAAGLLANFGAYYNHLVAHRTWRNLTGRDELARLSDRYGLALPVASPGRGRRSRPVRRLLAVVLRLGRAAVDSIERDRSGE